mmetsp:Transcript_3264/g.4732  ORF Transcript_3264/g.4732 Transcript_3264/m.4732 type:complete len:268 (-) Transcript_3264:294-1097(-)
MRSVESLQAAEPAVVRQKSDFGPRRLRSGLLISFGLLFGERERANGSGQHLAHVVPELLAVVEPSLGVHSLDAELSGENVGQFGTVPVPAACRFFEGVVVIGGSEQVAKHQFGDKDLPFGVPDDGEALAVVLDADPAGFPVDGDPDGRRSDVALQVVHRVDQNLVENFEEPRNELDASLSQGRKRHFGFGVFTLFVTAALIRLCRRFVLGVTCLRRQSVGWTDEQRNFLPRPFGGPDVGIRTSQNVFALRFFLEFRADSSNGKTVRF